MNSSSLDLDDSFRSLNGQYRSWMSSETSNLSIDYTLGKTDFKVTFLRYRILPFTRYYGECFFHNQVYVSTDNQEITALFKSYLRQLKSIPQLDQYRFRESIYTFPHEPNILHAFIQFDLSFFPNQEAVLKQVGVHEARIQQRMENPPICSIV